MFPVYTDTVCTCMWWFRLVLVPLCSRLLLTGKLSEAAEGNSLLGIHVLTSHIWLCTTVNSLTSKLKSLAPSLSYSFMLPEYSQANKDRQHKSKMLNTRFRISLVIMWWCGNDPYNFFFLVMLLLFVILHPYRKHRAYINNKVGICIDY